MLRLIPVIGQLVLLSVTVVADEVASEPVAFESHVLPLLQKAGCSQLACHGAFQGQGGFRLSLNGRDPDSDFMELTKPQHIDKSSIEGSYVLQKATAAIEHGGDQRIIPETPDYRILVDWIRLGADRGARLNQIRLKANPDIIELNNTPSARISITSEGHGSNRDISHLCTFESLEPTVCLVDDTGTVSRGELPGEGRVLVRYGRFSVIVNVIHPIRTPATNQGDLPSGADEIDRQIQHRIAAVGLDSQPLCDDAEFVRRVTLDLTGRLPTPHIVSDFVASIRVDKRERYVDQLLASPEYADYWSSWFARLSGCDEATLRNTSGVWLGISAQDQARLWQAWIRKRLADDTPYHSMVQGLLTAVDRESGVSWKAHLNFQRSLRSATPLSDKLIESYASRQTNPLYWAPNRFLGGKSGEFAEQFLGRGYRCAQCHDHPYEMISKADYRRLNTVFSETAFIHPTRERRTAIALMLFLSITIILGSGYLSWRNRNSTRILSRLTRLFLVSLSGTIPFILLSYKHLILHDTPASSPGLTLESLIKKLQLNSALTTGVILFGTWSACSVVLVAFSRSRPWAINLRSTAIAGLVFLIWTYCDFVYLSHQKSDGSQRANLANAARIAVFDWFGYPGSEFVELAWTQVPTDREISLPDMEPLLVPANVDPRIVFGQQLAKGSTPQLAQNVVNRIWQRLMRQTFVEPVDGFSKENPPVLPEALQSLTSEFVRQDWSLRKLLRRIVLTRTYQTKAVSSDVAVRGRYWQSFEPRALNELQLFRALNQVADVGFSIDESASELERKLPSERSERDDAIQAARLNQIGLDRLALTCGGRTLRLGSQDPLRVPMELSLMLQNHTEIRTLILTEGVRVRNWVSQELPPEKRIDELFLVAYGRVPKPVEVEAIQKFVKQSQSTNNANEMEIWGDVVWAVINSEEFLTVR